MSQSGKVYYTGNFRHALDDKFRLTIPAAWRSGHQETDVFLATPQPDGYIAVLPPPEIEKLHEKVSQIPLGDAAGQDFVATYFARTQSVSFDKAGRIGLTDALLKHAGIEKDVILVGSFNKFNIYSPARWEKVEARTAGDNYGDLMRRMGI